MSVRKTPTKQATGMGTIIGWIGIRKIRAVACGLVIGK